MNAAPGKHVAIYARVSMDEQAKGYSLPTQIEGCQKFAAEHGYTVAAEFVEDYTGTVYERPELNKVRDLARQGAINGLVVYDMDRFARGLAKQMVLEEEFTKAGVGIEYVLATYDDTPEGRFQKQIRAAVAELEREKIIERTVRGRRGRATPIRDKEGNVVQNGHVVPGGMIRYGYRYIPKSEDAVSGKGYLEIIEEEAEIVRLIYRWYTVGDETGRKLGKRPIAKRLSGMCVPTRFDGLSKLTRDGKPSKRIKRRRDPGVWSYSTVGNILRDETYCGVWHYNKTRGRKLRDKAEWIPVQVPAIINRATWEAARRRARENQIDFKKNKGGADAPKRPAKYEYLMRGRMTCGCCGLTVFAHSDARAGKPAYHYYQCRGQERNYAPDGHTITCTGCLHADIIDKIVWRYVKAVLQEPDKALTGLREHQEQEQAEIAPMLARLHYVEGQLANLEERRRNVLARYGAGKITDDELDSTLGQNDDMRRQYEAERLDLRRQLDRPDAITDDDIHEVMIRCEQIRQGIEYFTFEDRLRTLEWLKVTAIVNRGRTRADDTITVKGLLSTATYHLVDGICSYADQQSVTAIPFTRTLALVA